MTGNSRATRRDIVLGLSTLAAPASAREFWADPQCKDMRDWRLLLGKKKLQISIRYRPNIYKKVPIEPSFWQSLFYGKYAEDMSVVKICQAQRSPWIDIDWVTLSGEGLVQFKQDIGVTGEQCGQDPAHNCGLTLLNLRPTIAKTGWRDWRWKDGPTPGFLSDVYAGSPSGTGKFLLSKEKLLRGGQAWGILTPKGDGRVVFPTRFYINIDNGPSVMLDSMGFTQGGVEGLKDDLKVVEAILQKVLVA